jgi:uncharacterized protein YjbI with pentapeptide repeats
MNEKLNQYLNGVFAPYEGVKSVDELRADLLADLEERFRELKAEGRDEETAFAMTIDSIGDIEQTVRDIAGLSRALERKVLINFSASNLPKSDFAGVSAHQAKFEASELSGTDFAGADLTGSSFFSSNVRAANFDGTNLTDCTLSTSDMRDASFRKSILVRTNFNMSDLAGAKLIGVKLIDVKLSYIDLRNTVIEGCVFNGVNFKYCDLRNLRLDGQTFIGVKFDDTSLDEASFLGATLNDVSFHATWTWHSWSKKYYRAIKTIRFDGAKMDKLTYAALKGMEADLSKVTVI